MKQFFVGYIQDLKAEIEKRLENATESVKSPETVIDTDIYL